MNQRIAFAALATTDIALLLTFTIRYSHHRSFAPLFVFLLPVIVGNFIYSREVISRVPDALINRRDIQFGNVQSALPLALYDVLLLHWNCPSCPVRCLSRMVRSRLSWAIADLVSWAHCSVWSGQISTQIKGAATKFPINGFQQVQRAEPPGPANLLKTRHCGHLLDCVLSVGRGGRRHNKFRSA
jgi:hypothetical protein